jgi:membrane-associated phospholipid phosphatase
MLLLLHALWTPITLIFFVLLARPRSNPLQAVAQALLNACSTRGGRLTLLLGVLVLGLNVLECALEPWLARRLGYDLTAWVHGLEGDFAARVQATLPRFLAPLGVWFYLSGFVAGLLLPAVMWAADARSAALRALVRAYAANYAIGLAFYLFVPVREVGWSGLASVEPWLERLYAGLSAETRIGSALDNCFPSLHVSLTTSAYLVAREHGDAALRRVSAAIALGTAYIVVALGVHWALDAAAGIVLGAAAAKSNVPFRVAGRAG